MERESWYYISQEVTCSKAEKPTITPLHPITRCYFWTSFSEEPFYASPCHHGFIPASEHQHSRGTLSAILIVAM
ncbi:hypothetical protein Y1Q_0018026 [Alligator mississippiensis]|uniref:Uncharacterized protein n=1 Tax=Alligator mississippiensis TaxID=8496 RepID=A0A151MXX9_ALLMI|nr:hypothetical protein Y1Q_0018026 [Alligator mississippiensis]